MSRLTANLLLLFAAALWGFGNVVQKTVLDHFDALSAVGLRCLIGGLVALPFVLTERRLPPGAAHFSGLIRVVVLFAVSITLQQLCYLGATVTNASFLISTATVITPLAAWLLIGERPTLALILAAGSNVEPHAGAAPLQAHQQAGGLPPPSIRVMRRHSMILVSDESRPSRRSQLNSFERPCIEMEDNMVERHRGKSGGQPVGPGKHAHSFLRLAAVAAVALWGPPTHAADLATMNVDVAIAFAVDFSSSIEPNLADLQREGHAAALTSPEIISAISQNYLGCIGVAYFEWSSPGHTRTVLPWTCICGLEDAKAASSVISRTGDTGYLRRGRGGTSVSSAIDIGSLLLDQFPGNALKKVIDISSNGENNDGLPVQPSRESAIAKGYTINAIAIPAADENPEQPLVSYFARSVIGGSEAFVLSPKGQHDYITALRRKLVTEVSMDVITYKQE